MVESPVPTMAQSTLVLGLLLAGALHLGAVPRASAAVRLVASHSELRAGDVVTFEWSGLPEGIEEVELEYAAPGGRWARLSPEIEAEEREYRWKTPAGVAGAIRVRLMHGRRHEESIAAEITLRLVANLERAPAQGVRAADAWDLERPLRGPAISQWGVAHPVWSSARDLPVLATAAFGDEPAPETLALGEPARARHTQVPRTPRRSFESHRRSPLRN